MFAYILKYKNKLATAKNEKKTILWYSNISQTYPFSI